MGNMVGLYDQDWNLIDIFDTRPQAFEYAINRAIPAFKIEEL